MLTWFDKAVDQLEAELEKETITEAEFRIEMKALRSELEDHAAEAARRAYDDAMG